MTARLPKRYRTVRSDIEMIRPGKAGGSMSILEYELSQVAYTRYCVFVIGGDAVYLQDHKLNHNLYLGSGRLLSKAELRNYINSLNNDLRELSIRDFLTKHGFNVDA